MQVRNGEILRQKTIQKLLDSMPKRDLQTARPLVRSIARSLARSATKKRVPSFLITKSVRKIPLAPTFGHSFERVGKRQVAGEN